MPPANRELHVVAEVVIFLTHPGLRINSLLAENRAWVREIWFCEPRPRGVFGPSEDVFPIEIPARPGKILRIREFHVVHVRVLFLTCLGLRINLLFAGKLVLPIFPKYGPCTEASLGSQDMILRTEAVGMFLMPRGHFLIEIPSLTGGALDDPEVDAL
uniref:Uncharacterized protein n=1 Tax=Fagus sylvatica TaxID=28930 RepID=A0A2N9ECN6_FAGSY